MRVLFLLPGLHRVQRGAEVAFESVARELALHGDDVTLMGSGHPRHDDPYAFVRVPVIPRERFERWPNFPPLRNAPAYEGLSGVPGELRAFHPGDFDVTLTCGYPLENWVLRKPRLRGNRPAHVFVSQNGDWPAYANNREYRWFGCEGLVCTNPEYFERNKHRWNCALIPNGVDTDRFVPGDGDRSRFGLPADVPLVLMVSALEDYKRVIEGMRAVASLDGVAMAVAGDGTLRDEVDQLAAEILPGRFVRLSVDKTEMPELYRCADAFLHTTLAESFGNVYIEALATGLPIVAHDSTTTQWILGDAARLVDTHHHEAIVEALREALTPVSREATNTRATAASNRFAWSTIAAQYRTLMATAIEVANA